MSHIFVDYKARTLLSMLLCSIDLSLMMKVEIKTLGTKYSFFEKLLILVLMLTLNLGNLKEIKKRCVVKKYTQMNIKEYYFKGNILYIIFQ